MPQRVIHVGVGVFGRRWCREFLANNVSDGTIEVVAVVELDEASLAYGGSVLGVPPGRRYRDARQAFAENPVEFCTVVVPPGFHEAIIDLAIEHGVDVLCEKPIADTMAATVRIARKIREAGRKMAVTMSHRFDADKTALRRLVRSGTLGRISTVTGRFHADRRSDLDWSSPFRHVMAHPLLIEGAIHHLDIIADLAGSQCETLFASTWKPDWAEYVGDTDGMVSMVFANGVRAVYQGTVTAAVGLNDFYQDYIRVDGELGTAILNHREIELFMRASLPRQQRREGEGQKLSLPSQPKWINSWLIELFAAWRAGGPKLDTAVADNLQTSALVFAAIESSRTGATVRVQDFIAGFG